MDRPSGDPAGTSPNRPLGRVASYYARPAHFTTGGVSTSRVEWCIALAARARSVTLLDARDGLRGAVPEGSSVRIRTVPHRGRSRVTMVPRHFDDELAHTDLLLLHEGWTASNLVAAGAARRVGVPYVVIPHGVYDPHIARTLTLSRVRGRAERRMLEDARAVHVFFAPEVDHVRAIAPAARCIVTPLGLASATSIPTTHWSGAGTYVAWMGRYDIRHKGLDLLVDAVGSMAPQQRPRVRLRGPDHLGDRDRLRALIRERRLEPWMEVGEELQGMYRWDFYADAAAVVHPARWEAFGRSIVEALLIGVPMIISETSQLAKPLRTAGAAIVTATDPGSLAGALGTLADRAKLSAVGERGRAWATAEMGQEVAVDRFLAQLAELESSARADPVQARRRPRSRLLGMG